MNQRKRTLAPALLLVALAAALTLWLLEKHDNHVLRRELERPALLLRSSESLDQSSSTNQASPPETPVGLAAETNLPSQGLIPGMTLAPPSSDEFQTLKAKNEALSEELNTLQRELIQAKQRIPPPDEPEKAYVGPGVWISTEPARSTISKLMTASEGEGWKIKVWNHALLGDTEMEYVPLFLPDLYYSRTPAYRRAFATLDEGNWNNYLVLTFEKEGLKLDTITVSKTPRLKSFRTVEYLKRVD